MATLLENGFVSMLKEVEGLPNPVLRLLMPVLDEAERELSVALEVWLRREDGAARFTARKYRELLLQTRAMQRTIRKLEPVTERALRRGARAASILAASHLKTQAAQMAKLLGVSVIRMPVTQVAHFAEGSRVLMRRYKTSARRYAGQVGKDVRRQLAVGMARGESVSELTTRMMRVAPRMASGTPDAARMARGLFRGARADAERLVRTEVMHAYNQSGAVGIREAHQLDKGIQRKWDASLDGRICLTCRVLDDEVADVGKPFKEGGLMYPPAHPNCRCVCVAWHSTWG